MIKNLLSSTTDSSSSCGCESNQQDDLKSKLSEIACKGLPYKEIETCFNNSRVIIRLQNEKMNEDNAETSSCDCSEARTEESNRSFGSAVSSLKKRAVSFFFL